MRVHIHRIFSITTVYRYANRCVVMHVFYLLHYTYTYILTTTMEIARWHSTNLVFIAKALTMHAFVCFGLASHGLAITTCIYQLNIKFHVILQYNGGLKLHLSIKHLFGVWTNVEELNTSLISMYLRGMYVFLLIIIVENLITCIQHCPRSICMTLKKATTFAFILAYSNPTYKLFNIFARKFPKFALTVLCVI